MSGRHSNEPGSHRSAPATDARLTLCSPCAHPVLASCPVRLGRPARGRWLQLDEQQELGPNPYPNPNSKLAPTLTLTLTLSLTLVLAPTPNPNPNPNPNPTLTSSRRCRRRCSPARSDSARRPRSGQVRSSSQRCVPRLGGVYGCMCAWVGALGVHVCLGWGGGSLAESCGVRRRGA